MGGERIGKTLLGEEEGRGERKKNEKNIISPNFGSILEYLLDGINIITI